MLIWFRREDVDVEESRRRGGGLHLFPWSTNRVSRLTTWVKEPKGQGRSQNLSGSRWYESLQRESGGLGRTTVRRDGLSVTFKTSYRSNENQKDETEVRIQLVQSDVKGPKDWEKVYTWQWKTVNHIPDLPLFQKREEDGEDHDGYKSKPHLDREENTSSSIPLKSWVVPVPFRVPKQSLCLV